MSAPRLVAIVAVPALVAGVGCGAVLTVAGLPLLGAAAVAVVAAAGLAAWLWACAPRSALRALRAVPLRSAAGSRHGSTALCRLENVVEGLCTTHGIGLPELHIVESRAINAASVGAKRGIAHLVLTAGALERLDRLELEAVVARGLCEIRRGLEPATVLASVNRIPGLAMLTIPLLARARAYRSVIWADIEAVRLTTYPPALASALEKSRRSEPLRSRAAAAHLWLVTPKTTRTRAAMWPPAEHRIAVLGEL